ncbi:MAG: hypothetical protein Q9208_006581 [Pyrenodesmia sp. 3 TL-2023]
MNPRRSEAASTPDTSRPILGRLLGFNRRNGYKAHQEDTERALTTHEKARDITNQILSLLKERARLLGKPNLDLATQWDILRVLYHYDLSSEEDYFGLLGVDILATREKVLKALATYGMEHELPTRSMLEIQLWNSRSRYAQLEQQMVTRCRSLKWMAYGTLGLCCILAVGIVVVMLVGGRKGQ